jgi:hypothetical protein
MASATSPSASEGEIVEMESDKKTLIEINVSVDQLVRR